jgi:peptidoglycan L-alanyl-D-glutamate endopeptidase CwlK
MASRSLEELKPKAREKAYRFMAICAVIGIPVFVTCTYRSQQEQDVLFLKGRFGDPGPKVTWTKKSKHTERIAFDVALNIRGHEWDLKYDVSEDQIPDYQQLAMIGKLVGLKAGADFGDYCHFEDIK